MEEKSDRSESRYQILMLEGTEQRLTYHNTCSLTIKVVFLCISSFYFGYCLTYLSTLINNTDTDILDTVHLLQIRSMALQLAQVCSLEFFL